MSGNAALSAARKRRASSSPGMIGGGGGGGGGGAGGSYYSVNNIQNIQAMMKQQAATSSMNSQPQPPPRGKSSTMVFPSNDGSQIPINIYENIELIKQQIEQRTKLIKTQGASMPPEKLKILHKQNEVQFQILKQRMLMVQEMETTAASATVRSPQSPLGMVSSPTASASGIPEPKFIYEKGIPRLNPKYVEGGREKQVSFAGVPTPTTPTHSHSHPHSHSHSHSNASSRNTAVLTPFVSMMTSTGATPPPLVIIKSHDEKIGEHDAVLRDLSNRVNYIHSRVDELSQNMTSHSDRTSNAERATRATSATDEGGDADEGADEDAGEEADAEDETVLLMDTVMNDLINSRDFVQGIVDKIVNETNLSETILKIEPIIKENQELRSLIHSQQKMLNEMNTLVFRLLNAQDGGSEEHHAEEEHDVINHITDTNIDENGLYESVESNESILPVDNYIVPNMSDNAVISVIENIVDRAVTESHFEHDETHEHDETDQDEQEYDHSQPHFPSSSAASSVDTQIALVVNEI
jgi:hypothetical protein